MIKNGDFLNIFVNGRPVPKSDGSDKPQWFIALNDCSGAESLELKPFNGKTSTHKAIAVHVNGGFKC